MKRFIVVVSLLLGATINSFAQSEHRLSLGLGWACYGYISERIQEDELKPINYPGPHDHGTYEYTGEDLCCLPISFNIHYEHTLNDHFGVGGCLGLEHLKMKQYTEKITSVGEETSPHGITYTSWDKTYETGFLHRFMINIMPEAAFYWFRKKHTSMYSKVGVGVRLVKEIREFNTKSFKNSEFQEGQFIFQVSPVCLEVGGERLRAFFEFGYGEQGVVQYGIRYTIKKEDASAQE